MSDIGVHSNVYQRVREYGDLVDQVLVAIKSGNSTLGDASRQRLGDLLVGVSAMPPRDLNSAWLGMLLGDSDHRTRAEWAKVGRALLSPGVETRVVERLEELAGRIEQRRTDALAKMRGLRM